MTDELILELYAESNSAYTNYLDTRNGTFLQDHEKPKEEDVIAARDAWVDVYLKLMEAVEEDQILLRAIILKNVASKTRVKRMKG